MKVTAKEAIDYSSISNINRLINIDWYRLISILIDYRFHRLSTPGYIEFTCDFQVEKIDSDLDYAVLKLSNEFSEKFEDGLPSEVY